MPSRQTASIWHYLFGPSRPYLTRKTLWGVLRDSNCWHDSFGRYLNWYLLCPLLGHRKIKFIGDDSGGPDKLYCFKCDRKVLPRRKGLYVFTGLYTNYSADPCVKKQVDFFVSHIVGGEEKRVAQHERLFLITNSSASSISYKRIPVTDLPLYMWMNFTDYGREVLENLSVPGA